MSGMASLNFTDLEVVQAEFDRATDPFPGGLVAQSNLRPGGTSEAEWASVMGKGNAQWDCSSDETCWGYAVAAVTKSVQDLSLVLNTLLTRAEGGRCPDPAALGVFLGKLRMLIRFEEDWEAFITDSVLPALEKHLSLAETADLKHLKRCRNYRENRTRAVEASLAAYMDAGADSPRALANLRCAQAKFNVFQTTLLTLHEVLVQRVMWPVRKYLTATQWRSLLASTPLSVTPPAMMMVGRSKADATTCLLTFDADAKPSLRSQLHALSMLVVVDHTWTRPLSELCGNTPATTFLQRLLLRAARALIPRESVAPVSQ